MILFVIVYLIFFFSINVIGKYVWFDLMFVKWVDLGINLLIVVKCWDKFKWFIVLFFLGNYSIFYIK